MKFTIFLLLLGSCALLLITLWVAFSKRSGSKRSTFKKTKITPTPHRGYPVVPLTREQIAARAARTRHATQVVNEERASAPGMQQVQELLKNNPPPTEDSIPHFGHTHLAMVQEEEKVCSLSASLEKPHESTTKPNRIIENISQNPTETDEYQLERKATELKKSGDLDGAIECLRRAAELRGIKGGTTRLAKYLQLAGRFDEAMDEIEILLDNGKEWAELMFGHQPTATRRLQLASWKARIHRDAVIICKREKNEKLRLIHESAVERWDEKRESLEEAAREASKKQMKAWEEAVENGPDAMADFSKKQQREDT